MEQNVQIILGPGANIKRSPLCGRNFEYYSEDPFLSSQLATMHIKGVQSQGVGTSLKHFAVNNQETNRFNINAIVDERTLREIYLASFEGAVTEGQPWTVMAAYEKINGDFCSQNQTLLTDILRNQWGFEGIVVSDWFAVSERDKALAAGLDLEMPTSMGVGKQKIIDAVKSGSVSEEVLNASVERLLTIVFKAADNKKENATYDKTQHHQIAQKAALESMVLLKNEDHILPLNKKGKIAVIGAFAKNPRYQGAGSSRINPNKLDIPLGEIQKAAQDAKIIYTEGYSTNSAETDETLIREAKNVALDSDVAIIFAGLPEMYDMEGADRKHLDLPASQNALIDAVSEVQKNVVVVLFNGSAVEMPWLHKVKGVFEAYLGGQAMAGALAVLLFGDSNPSGKLAETFPEKFNQTPSFINFPGEKDKVEYREGLFVGYRYYDKVGTKPMFPFGHGLSYTSFEYSDLRLDKKEMADVDELTVTAKIKNIGDRTGQEIVQLYVRDVESSVIRPIKELKGFEKILLEPGEEKCVTFKLGKRAFAYYNLEMKDWHVESGDFEILLGKSSRDIVLSETVHVKSSLEIKKHFTQDSTIADIKDEPAAQQILAMFSNLQGAIDTIDLGMDTESVLGGIKVSSLIPISQGAFTLDNLTFLLKALNGD